MIFQVKLPSFLAAFVTQSPVFLVTLHRFLNPKFFLWSLIFLRSSAGNPDYNWVWADHLLRFYANLLKFSNRTRETEEQWGQTLLKISFDFIQKWNKGKKSFHPEAALKNNMGLPFYEKIYNWQERQVQWAQTLFKISLEYFWGFCWHLIVVILWSPNLEYSVGYYAWRENRDCCGTLGYIFFHVNSTLVSTTKQMSMSKIVWSKSRQLILC